MEIAEYEAAALSTAKYENDEVVWAQLPEEVGELFSLKKILLRGDMNLVEFNDNVIKELGDILWTVTMLSFEHGFSLQQVAEVNMVKLRDRLERGVLHGRGDNR